MKVATRPRQAGKTHDLVEWVKQGDATNSYPFWSRVIVTHTMNEANRLRRQYDLNYLQVFTHAEWKNALLGLGPDHVEIAVDNLDLILNSVLGYRPDIVTITGSNF